VDNSAQLVMDLTQGTRRNIFVGEKSKTWNAANAAKAVEMEKAGVAPENIWSATGTFRGPEGKLRQEVSDNLATGVPPDPNFPMTALGGQFQTRQVFEHPNLYKAYDDVGLMPTKISPNNYNKEGGAYFDPYANGFERIEMGSLPVGDRKSVMLHELQHAIQEREGFAEGGSPNTMILALEKIAEQKRQQAQEMFRMSSANDPLDPTRIVKPGARKKGLQLEKEARELDSKALTAYHSEQAKFDLYQRLAGEAEARAVQTRMNMTPQERLATYPYQSYDVPINQLIVRTK